MFRVLLNLTNTFFIVPEKSVDTYRTSLDQFWVADGSGDDMGLFPSVNATQW